MTTKPSRLRREFVELAEAKHANGTLSSADYRKITMRDVQEPEIPSVTAEEIRGFRERAQVSFWRKNSTDWPHNLVG